LTIIKSLEDTITALRDEFVQDQNTSIHKSSTLSTLFSLQISDYKEKKFNDELDYLCRKYEVTKRLLHCYNSPTSDLGRDELSPQGLQLFSALVYARIMLQYLDQSIDEKFVKNLNTCLKLFSNIQLPESMCDAQCQVNEIVAQFPEISSNIVIPKIDDENEGLVATHLENSKKSLQIIPVDVLFYEGPIARAYLEVLKSVGCQPRRIIRLIAENDLQNKKPVGKFLPSFLRYRYASYIQRQRIHFWPKKLIRDRNKFFNSARNNIAQALKIDTCVMNRATDLLPLEQYSENIENCPITSLKDEKLYKYLQDHPASTYLYTGGGILPSRVLGLKDSKFIHIHPGYLPGIGGADCLLWSLLLTGLPSASCFYMDKGIDTGDVIKSNFLPLLQLGAPLAEMDKKEKYRFIYSFVDPWVRAYVLRSACLETKYFSSIESAPQGENLRPNYNFMHDALIEKSLTKIFED
jgi:hypothetical protein